MSDTSGPRYTINSLPDFRFELRRNGLVMGFYGSYEQAQLASQQIDLEVAQSGWSMPPKSDIKTCSLTDAQLLDTSIVARADYPVEFGTIRAAFRELYDRRVASAAGEGLEPVAWVRAAMDYMSLTGKFTITWGMLAAILPPGPPYAATQAARAAVLEAALRNLLASVDAVLVELKPGQSLSPAGAGRTNALEAARNEARRALKEKN